MPRGTVKVPGVSNAGAGKPGYCKLCDLEDGTVQNQLDDRTRQGWTPKQLNVWLGRQIEGWTGVSDPTVYNHRKHVQHPQDKLVTAVKRTESRALTVPPQSSADDFLGSLIAIGQRRALENPEDVTIDHAIRAATALKQNKDGGKSGIQALVALITVNAIAPVMADLQPPFDIEGEYVEVSEAS